MGAILVASTERRAGRTAVVAGLAHMLLYDGRRVHLARLRSDDGADESAASDAGFFASVYGVEAANVPLTLNDAAAALARVDADVTSLLEAADGMDVADAAKRLNATVLLVARPSEEALASLSTAAGSLGSALAAIVISGAVPHLAASLYDQLRSDELPVLGVIPEDRDVAGPTIQSIIDALDGRILLDGASRNESVSSMQIGTIGSDPGLSYFGRTTDKAVVTRFDKTDVMLSALNTETPLIVICGGNNPSGYVLDRASNNRNLTLVLCDFNTGEAISRVSALYQQTPFVGERKLERMGELMRSSIQDHSLIARLSS